MSAPLKQRAAELIRRTLARLLQFDATPFIRGESDEWPSLGGFDPHDTEELAAILEELSLKPASGQVLQHSREIVSEQLNLTLANRSRFATPDELESLQETFGEFPVGNPDDELHRQLKSSICLQLSVHVSQLERLLRDMLKYVEDECAFPDFKTIQAICDCTMVAQREFTAAQEREGFAADETIRQAFKRLDVADELLTAIGCTQDLNERTAGRFRESFSYSDDGFHRIRRSQVADALIVVRSAVDALRAQFQAGDDSFGTANLVPLQHAADELHRLLSPAGSVFDHAPAEAPMSAAPNGRNTMPARHEHADQPTLEGVRDHCRNLLDRRGRETPTWDEIRELWVAMLALPGDGYRPVFPDQPSSPFHGGTFFAPPGVVAGFTIDVGERRDAIEDVLTWCEQQDEVARETADDVGVDPKTVLNNTQGVLENSKTDSPPSIISLGHGIYQIGNQHPLKLSDTEHYVLDAFRNRPAMNLEELKQQSGVENARDVLKKISKRDGFGKAIRFPGKKNAGGYYVMIQFPES